MWRAAGVLCMTGCTDRYAIIPRVEYVFGLVISVPSPTSGLFPHPARP